MSSGNIERKANILERFKNKMIVFCDKLAEENEKAFGKGTLDCCQLNKQKTENKK